MQIVTRWVDEKTTDFNEVDRLLMSDHPDETPEIGAQYKNWQIDKVFPEHKRAVFNGREVVYNYYSYSVDQIPGGTESYDDETYTKRGFIIPYSSGGKIRYIISRNTYAQTFIRKMLFYTGKLEIVSNSVDFTGDMFVWLISKVYNSEHIISSESDTLEDLNIDSIKGFKGNTEDLLAKVSMSGESVMNIISALSFLIESQNLNQITVDLSYRNHTNLEISLNNKNTIGLYDEKYLGELNQSTHEEIIATCMILLYTEIIPILIQKYRSDVDANLWGQGRCVSFLQKVADDLAEKVKNRIEDLNSRPEQLRLTINPEGVVEG